MSERGGDSTGPELKKAGPRRWLRTDVRTLIAMVACCGVVLWAWRHLVENIDPVRLETRAIQKRALASLKSATPAERLTAIQDLERVRSEDISVGIGPLIGVLGDPDTRVRFAAIRALDLMISSLAKSGSGSEAVHDATEAFLRGLKDSDPAFRAAAAQALASTGASLAQSGSGSADIVAGVVGLIGALDDSSSRVRAAAAASLGSVSAPRLAALNDRRADPGAVLAAMERALGDSESLVRAAAVHALAAHPGSGDPPKALIRGFRDESAEVRQAAAAGLTFFRQGLDAWVPELLRIAEQDPDPAVRERSQTTLGFACNPPAVTAAVVPLVIPFLGSPKASVRSRAASVLGELRRDAHAAIPQLLQVLTEPLARNVVPVIGPAGVFDPGCAAAWALGRIAPGSAEAKQVIAALTDVVRSGPESRGGWAAVALSEFGPDAVEAVPALVTLAEEANPDDKFERRSSAVRALGKIAPGTASEDRTISVLLPLLDSPSIPVLAQAIQSLALFGAKTAPALAKVRDWKNDRDFRIREAVARVLPILDAAEASAGSAQ
jgi:HEAT repeat protein